MPFEFLRHWTEEHAANGDHDICRGDDNGNTCDDSQHPLPAPDAHEDWEFCDEAREARHTHRDQTADDKANASKRHGFHHAAEFGDLARVRAIIDHASDGKEESRHNTVREHLHACAHETIMVERGNAQHHESHVGDGGETNHVFHVGLDEGNVSAIDHGDTRKSHDKPSPLFRAFGQKHDAHAQSCECAEFHQHARMEHGDGCRRGNVTIR